MVLWLGIWCLLLALLSIAIGKGPHAGFKLALVSTGAALSVTLCSIIGTRRNLRIASMRARLGEVASEELAEVERASRFLPFNRDAELAKAEQELAMATRDHEHAVQEARGAWRGKSGPAMMFLTLFGEGQEGLMRQWTHSHSLEITKWQARRDFLNALSER